MPHAVFVLRFDDYHGFIVVKRYPSTFSLNERLLNLVYVEHEESKRSELKLSEIDGHRMVTFGSEDYPGWLVCFVLGYEEDFVKSSDVLTGMGQFILELAVRSPELLDIGEILRKRSTIYGSTAEQLCASVFLNPLSVLVLDRLRSEGAIRSKRLEQLLSSQLQSENVNLREAVLPLMSAGLVRVVMVGEDKEASPPKRGVETVFLVKDVFVYKAPPINALEHIRAVQPTIIGKYRELVTQFFAKYNPTSRDVNPDSPAVAERQKMARLIVDRITYNVLLQLREGINTVAQLCTKTHLPDKLVSQSLHMLETEGIVVHYEPEDIWLLISDPRFETFMPEYALAIIVNKYRENQIENETVATYLELLNNTWRTSD